MSDSEVFFKWLPEYSVRIDALDEQRRELNTLMHPDSGTRLSDHLRQMQARGTGMQLLFMRVRTTTDGMIAGFAEGELELDYPCIQAADFVLAGRFLAFCKQQSLDVTRDRWGKHLVYRASIGADIANGVALVARCFQAVYGHSGPFALDLRGWGGSPA